MSINIITATGESDFVGDSGSGGVAGLVPAPSTGDATKYLKGDGTWTALGSLATQSGTFSGTSSGTNTGDQNVFTTIAVSGQSNIVSDAASDTLTFVAGSGMTITTNAGSDTITFVSSGGGSQTPWTSNIDGATYNLTNVDTITGLDTPTTYGLKITTSSGDLQLYSQSDINIKAGEIGANTSAALHFYSPGSSIWNSGGTLYMSANSNAQCIDVGNTGNLYIANTAGDTYVNASGSIKFNSKTFTTPTTGDDNKVLTYDDMTSTMQWETPTGASPTPWTQDIEAGTYNILNTGVISYNVQSRAIYDSTTVVSVSGQNRELINSSGTEVFKWGSDVVIGGSMTPKISIGSSGMGFFGASQTSQPASVVGSLSSVSGTGDDATINAAISSLNDLIAKLKTLGLIAT